MDVAVAAVAVVSHLAADIVEVMRQEDVDSLHTKVPVWEHEERQFELDKRV